MATSPPPEFDAYAADYDAALNQGLKLTGESKEYYAEGRLRWMQQCFAKLGIRKPTTCLDYGCGTGTSASYLMREFKLDRYVGYDPSAESISEANEQQAAPGVSFTAEFPTVEPGSFDLAFVNGVFHHIPLDQRAECVRQVYAALKPGAWFAFWENNRWNPMVHFVMSRVPFDRDAQMLFPHQAAGMLRRGGLMPKHQSYQFVFPGFLKQARVLEPALSPLPLGGQYLILAQKPLS